MFAFITSQKADRDRWSIQTNMRRTSEKWHDQKITECSLSSRQSPSNFSLKIFFFWIGAHVVNLWPILPFHEFNKLTMITYVNVNAYLITTARGFDIIRLWVIEDYLVIVIIFGVLLSLNGGWLLANDSAKTHPTPNHTLRAGAAGLPRARPLPRPRPLVAAPRFFLAPNSWKKDDGTLGKRKKPTKSSPALTTSSSSLAGWSLSVSDVRFPRPRPLPLPPRPRVLWNSELCMDRATARSLRIWHPYIDNQATSRWIH